MSKTCVVLATDRKFLAYVSPLLMSISANYNGEEPLPIVILISPDIAESDALFPGLFPAFTNLNIILRSPKGINSPKFVEFTKQIPHMERFTSAIAYRYFMGTACAEFSKAIYIDIDCVIARDIQPMLDFKLVGAPIAAFPEIQIELEFVRPALAEYKDYSYFNSGVLIVDLDYWRKNKIEELLLDESLSLGSTLGFADQDILNRVFRNNWTPLSMNFNYMINTYPNIKLTDPIVVHFAGLGKPWIISTVDSEWKDLWVQYARM